MRNARKQHRGAAPLPAGGLRRALWPAGPALKMALAVAGLALASAALALDEPKRPLPPKATPPPVHQAAPVAAGRPNLTAETGRGGVQQQHYTFQEHDVRRFSDQDRVMWQGGGWHHESHNGRLGYWWFAGGSWYFYDNPVYPYPVVVSDTVYVDPDPGVVDDAPPQLDAPPPGYWYYCDNPPGYYPYIGSCATQFRAVPAQPPPPQ